MTVNSALREAVQQLREYFSNLGDDSPIQSLLLEDGGVAFTVRGNTGSTLASITLCWTEADNYPNSGCILFGHDAVSVLNERFQDRGQLGEVVKQVLRTFGREVDIPQGTSTTAMEEDPAARNADDGDAGMEEGSDADWGDVETGSADNDAYASDNEASEQQAEDDDEDDDGDEEDDDEERDLIILCSTNLGRWERHEAALEAETATTEGASKQALSSTQGVAAKRQIFNPREAFHMLSRELLDFLKARHLDCSVETEGDDLYHWIVDLGSFAEGSPLARDMREVSRRYFYSTVRLRLRFMRGLHPFFPPSVEVVWPHLAGPLLGAVASHPMLTLENWDPWRPAMDTVRQIKAFLETHARVDLDNPTNDIRRHSHSTYTPLERGLSRLEALSGVSPLCLQQAEIAQLYAARDSFDKDAARLLALAEAGKKRGRPDQPAAKRTREVVWARGTGYGSGNDKGGEHWDAKATEAAQRARDSEIQILLDTMTSCLAQELGPRVPLPGEAEEAAAGTKAAKDAGGEAAEAAKDTEATGTAVATDSGNDGASAAAASGAPVAMEGVETAAGGAIDTSAGAAPGLGAGERAAESAAAAGAMEPRLGPEGCAVAIRSSCLLPFMVRELQLASFTDMGARHVYYTSLLRLTRELCRPATHNLLWQEVGQGGGAGGMAAASSSGARSVATILMAGLRSAAKVYLSVLGSTSAQSSSKPTTGPTSVSAALSTSAANAFRQQDKAAIAADKAYKEEAASQRMAHIIMQVAAYLAENTPPPSHAAQQPHNAAGADRAVVSGGGAGAGAADADAADGSATERAASGALASTSDGGGASGSGGPSLYMSTLKPMQMDTVSGLGRAHHYSGAARSEAHVPRTRAVRLAKEVASLESLLPLSESSSVFVRVDETAVQMWKAIVVGPEDTPYSGGCFVFDLYFPPQYPTVPPQVQLLTTGGGRVRFNPNLYAEGKVCLSLLGTWAGDKGESWNADVSTAVQVLISIQSLIMVPHPYFNEPSYEAQTGERGQMASRDYSKAVRENCVRYAMLDVLRHPPAAFADLVRAHFRLRRDVLLRQIGSWADEAQSYDAVHAGRLRDMRRELEALIATL